MLRFLVLGLALAALAVPGVASAATFNVTKTADTLDGSCTPDDCSLREAVEAANADAAADTVILPAGTYPLTLVESGADNDGGDLNIDESTTLTGAGARVTVIQGTGADRVIDMSSKITVEISGVTITGGGGVQQGAGIFGSGVLTVRDSALVGNSTSLATTTSSRQGAGIFLNGNEATLERVLIANNTAASIAGDSFAPQGAGVFANGPVSLTNVTIAGNTLDGTLGRSFGPQGAGLFVNDDSVTLANVTVAGNTAVDGDSQGGGIFYNGLTSVRHSIVAGNTGGGNPDECFVNGTVTSAAMNLATDAADCGFTAPADVSADPLLAALADNGGNSDTRALGAGSPAIDRVPFADCPDLDQRGFARAGAGAACDLGAHENGAPVAPQFPGPPPPPPPPPPPAAVVPPVPVAPPPAVKTLKASVVFSFPTTKRCVSRRSFRIRIRKIKGVKFVKATVLVNGKRVKVVRGRRLIAPVNLKGLPKGRFTVKITALTSDKRKVTGKRRYKTCAPKSKKRRRAPKL